MASVVFDSTHSSDVPFGRIFVLSNQNLGINLQVVKHYLRKDTIALVTRQILGKGAVFAKAHKKYFANVHACVMN